MEYFNLVRYGSEPTGISPPTANRRKFGLTGWKLVPVLAAVSMFLVGERVLADDPQWYVGAAAGQSTLKPSMKDSGFTVTDDSDTGYKVFLGTELSNHLSTEVFFADLGTAELSPTGSVGYQTYGASVQLAFPHNNPGVFGYIKGGVIGVNTDDDLSHDADDSFSMFAGLGAEYQLRNGYSVRGEYERLTQRAELVSLSLVKRFGGEPGSVEVDQQTYLDTPAREPVVQREALVSKPPLSVSFMDSDRDGVLDTRDRCKQTPAGAKVDARGCPTFLGVMADIRFDPGSDYLNALAKVALNQVARGMQGYSGQQFIIVGHSDSQEATGSRKKLSVKRAFAVARHLIGRGVPKDLLRVGGFGAAKPAASNSNETGRASNRRIELYLPKQG